MIPVMIGITLITFFVIQLAPGKPTDTMTEMNAKVSSDTRHKLIALYGLDKPWHIQYFAWLKRVARLNFGESFRDGKPAITKIGERLPATLLLNVTSLILILIAAIPIGVLSALKKDSWFDKLSTLAVFIGFSVPAFWFALLLMTVFGIKLGILPISGLRSLNFDELTLGGKILDISRHLVLPVFVSSFGALAGLSRYVRSSMIDVLSQEYIRAAFARGISESKVIFGHALGNALLPVVTILGLSLPGLIGGGFIFETIFSYPGMGRLGFDAIMSRDYPVIMATGTIAAFLTLLGNMLADITYALVDPRIRNK